MGDRVVLSYGDSLLRGRDVVLLQVPNWLNDAVIGFCLEHMSENLPNHFREKVTMISPEVAHYIKLGEDSLPLEIFLEPLNLGGKDFVFLAVNDQNDSNTAGGSHWSLLVFSRPDHKFLHFDSASSNFGDASRIAKRLYPFLKTTLPSDQSATIFPGVEEGKGGKQTNSYDCGVFLVWHAQGLLDVLGRGGNVLTPLSDVVKQEYIEDKRQEWSDLILKLSKSS